MNQGVFKLAAVLAVACAVSVGCGSDDDSLPGGAGGAGGKGGASGSAGKAGSSGGGGKAGAAQGGAAQGGAGASGASGAAMGGAAGSEDAGAGGIVESAGEAGMGQGGEGGEGGVGGVGGSPARGALLVRSVALCGGCHTATGGMELAGNVNFKGGQLPAPNLTPDATGIGEWTDAQIINAIRNGVDDEGRTLDSAMPYWLFHNMSDSDAKDIVAFLRSLPPVAASVGANNPDATPVTPLLPSAFPASSLQPADPEYAAAQQGRYLLSGVAQCVKCHSPAASGLPAASFFSGVAPANATTIFSSNITPDTTSGIGGWTATDVANALKLGKNKANVTLCGSMPSAAKGYGGMTDADAHAIGVYLTTIPAVLNAAAAPTLEPACP
ncbi:MAG: cytochrome c [Polyangiaceae bacterium]